MYKFREVIKGLVLNAKLLFFTRNNNEYLLEAGPLPKIEDIKNAMTLAFSNIVYPDGTPAVVKEDLGIIFRHAINDQVNNAMETYQRNQDFTSFLKGCYSDLSDHFPLIPFLINISNPFSEYKLLDRFVFFGSSILAKSLPSLVFDFIQFIGVNFCQLSSENHFDQCMEHLDDFSNSAYLASIGVSFAVVSGGIFYSSH